MAPVGYYNGFMVVRIDADGVAIPITSGILDINAGAYGSVITDDFGYVPGDGAPGSAIGDSLEFSHSSYPNVFIRIAAASVADAEALEANYIPTFVVEDLSTAREPTSAEVWLEDLDNAEARTVRLGFAPLNSTTKFKYENLASGRNYRVYTNYVDRNLARRDLRYQDAPSTDFVASSSLAGAIGDFVSSVGLSMPSLFLVSGSPVTSTGTLTASLVNQTANRIFAGPSSGGAGAPTFRTLAAADLPSLSSGLTGILPIANGGTNASSAGIASFNNITGYSASGATGTTSSNLVFSASPTLTGNVKGGTFNADGGTNPGNTYFYLSTSQAFSSNSSGMNLYVNNSLNTNNGLFGIIAEARQGVDRTGLNGVIYGGKFTANVAGDAQTAYGLQGRLSVDAGKTLSEGGAIIFSTTINGTVTAFYGLRQELINAGTVPDFYGTFLNVQNNSSATITNAIGLRIQVLNNGNTMTSAKGIEFAGYGGSGTITTNYLIYAASGTAIGTTKYGLYFLPDMASHHVGKFGLGSGNTTPTARLQVRDTSEPLRLEYDASNYMKVTLSSVGAVTFDAVGSGASFIFSDPVTVRIKPRVQTPASANSFTPNADNDDMLECTSLAHNTTIQNPSGTPFNGQRMVVRLKDNGAGTGHSVAHGSIYRSFVATMVTTVPDTKSVYEEFEYNSTDNKWDCIRAGTLP